MKPIQLKIDRSINEVATENDYSIIINTELPAGQRLLAVGRSAMYAIVTDDDGIQRVVHSPR